MKFKVGDIVTCVMPTGLLDKGVDYTVSSIKDNLFVGVLNKVYKMITLKLILQFVTDPFYIL